MPTVVSAQTPDARRKLTGASGEAGDRTFTLEAATVESINAAFDAGGGTNFGANTRDPNSEIFGADNTWEWQARLSGGYQLPYGVLVSANFQHRSGNPWARTVLFRGGRTIPSITLRVEQITRRLPHLNIVDLRVEKRFALGSGKSLSLRSNVLNLTNTNSVTNFTAQSGPNFGIPTQVYLPWVIDFAVAYTF